VGQNIVFDGPHYSPSTPEGRKLLVHELAHTVQQGNGGRASGPGSLKVSRPSDTFEREADSVAESAAAGKPVSVRQQAPMAVHRSFRKTLGDIGVGAGLASVAVGVAGFATNNTGLAVAGFGLGALGLIGGSILRSGSKPAPTSIRLVQVHQVPIDDYGVARGFRWGFGGVSEFEISNGDVDYQDAEIEEHFVGGDCQNKNKSGEGGTGGSSFKVGQGFTLPPIGRRSSFPAKRNTFYDSHLRFHDVRTGADPGPPQNLGQACIQQYVMDGQVIAGKSFSFRQFLMPPQQLDGKTVAVENLDVQELSSAAAPGQPAANPPNSGTPPAAGQPGN